MVVVVSGRWCDQSNPAVSFDCGELATFYSIINRFFVDYIIFVICKWSSRFEVGLHFVHPAQPVRHHDGLEEASFRLGSWVKVRCVPRTSLLLVLHTLTLAQFDH